MSFIDPIMSPFLNMNPFLAILLITLLFSLLTTIVYKFMTDQVLLKSLKEELKKIQKEVKTLKDNPEKMMKKNQEFMQKNMVYLTKTIQPLLINFIPLILIFGWLGANFAYEPIMPGQDFQIDILLNKNGYGDIEVIPPRINNSILYLEESLVKSISSNKMSFNFKALEEGTWDLLFRVNNQTDYPITVKVDENSYMKPDFTKFQGRDIKSIVVGNEKKVILNLFGIKFTWLWIYFILSVIFTTGLRKLLKLY
jgi:uncharacterized membrane protein (DUF106 family)